MSSPTGSVPLWLRALHRVVTYGQSAGRVERNRQNWESHYLDSAAAGAGRLRLVVVFVWSALTHVWARALSGEPTGVMSGLFALFGALSAASFALVPDDPMPDRVHLHIGLGIAAYAAVFLVWPQWQPALALALAGVVGASGMIHGMTEATFSRIGDYVIFAGSVLFSAAAVPFVASAAFGGRRWRTLGLLVLAGGLLLLGVGNLDWWNATQDLGYALSCLFSAAAALLFAGSIANLRNQQPSLQRA